jgi:hypothetical protein
MEHGSYLLIQPGMTVTGPDGSLGSVSEVVADSAVDVFRGVVVTYGLLATHRAFIPADAVVGVDDAVEVSITRAELSQLPPPPTHTPTATS